MQRGQEWLDHERQSSARANIDQAVKMVHTKSPSWELIDPPCRTGQNSALDSFQLIRLATSWRGTSVRIREPVKLVQRVRVLTTMPHPAGNMERVL